MQAVTQEIPSLNDAIAFAVRELREFISGKRSNRHSGYDVDAPTLVNRWASMAARQDSVRADRVRIDAGPIFSDALAELCGRGLLKPSVPSANEQSVGFDGGFCLTSFGRTWLSGEGAKLDVLEPGLQNFCHDQITRTNLIAKPTDVVLQPNFVRPLDKDNNPAAPDRHFLLSAFAVSVTIAFLFHATPDMPLGTTPDEAKKAFFVLHGTQDFYHPILLLQTVRVLNSIFNYADINSIAALGRAVVAAFGGLYVFSTILLARLSMGAVPSILAGILAAAAPLTAVHAQNFKEDIVVAPMLVLSIITLLRLSALPTSARAVLFGIFAGLALSAKYIGAIVILLPVLLLMFSPKPLTKGYFLVFLFFVQVGLARAA